MTRVAKRRCEAMYSVQECPRNVRNECTNEADAPYQDNSQGGQLDRQEGEGRVEVNLSGANIVDGAEYDGRHCGRTGNGSNVETDAPCQGGARWPAGRSGRVETHRAQLEARNHT